MNRFVAEGIALDVASGKRVVYVGSAVACASAVRAISARVPEPRKVRLGLGQERVEHGSGGGVGFVRAGNPHALRGVDADVVMLDVHPAPKRLVDDCLAAARARGGNVVPAC